jgi:hypothetical protein
MDMHQYDRRSRLRQRPPSWPRRNDGFDAASRRWEREPEPFEDDAVPEFYPGALVMEDLFVTDNDVATLRIIARYAVVRLLSLSLAGALTGVKLRTERQIALDYLAQLPACDWERRTLERVAMRCRQVPAPALVEAATIAAEAAAKRSQIMGAFSLYRSAYELAIAEKWWAAAAQVAHGIAQLARLDEARYSVRLWRRRAAVLERRAVREAEAEARCSGGVGAEACAGRGATVDARTEAAEGSKPPVEREES